MEALGERPVGVKEVLDRLAAGDGMGTTGDGGAEEELAVLDIFGRCIGSNTPLLTSSCTASMAELFPTKSFTPMCLRWERAWLPRPLRFSNFSPQRTQVQVSDILSRLLTGDVGREVKSEGRFEEEEDLEGLLDLSSSRRRLLIGSKFCSFMIWYRYSMGPPCMSASGMPICRRWARA